MSEADSPATMVRKLARTLNEDAVDLKTKADFAAEGLLMSHAKMPDGPKKPTRKELSMFLEGNALMAVTVAARLATLATLIEREAK